jgi:NAD-dependent deacetylase
MSPTPSSSASPAGSSDAHLDDVLRAASRAPGPVVVLTGAGISAESGIPTFRGPEGYWTVGSRNYHPEELATLEMFRRDPQAVWGWYLHRLRVCRAARPNAAHRSLVELEAVLGDRFWLLTQNVDGLHLEAGSSRERTLEIHGNLRFARCSRECGAGMERVPVDPPSEMDPERLRCGRCGAWLRPHVLWFDEVYDEPRYRFETAIGLAQEAALLVVVGTSGATALPLHVGTIVARRGAALVDLNPEPNPFSDLAASTPQGCVRRGRATDLVPDLVRRCLRASS